LTNATGLPISTGLSGLTTNGVAYATSSTALATGSGLTYDGTTLGNSGAFGSSTASLTLKNSSTASTSNIVEQQFWARDTFTGFTQKGAFGLDTSLGVGNQYGDFYWKTSYAGAPTEKMRLTSAGYLGIGTSSPNRPLSLVSSSSSSQEISNFFASSLSNSNYVDFLMGVSASTDRTGIIRFQNGTGAGDSSLQFGIYGQSPLAMTLSYSGNLGLGVTPSAWSSSFGVIQGYSGWSISGDGSNSNSVDFLSNAYRSGSNTYTYLANSSATRYQQKAGAHVWYNAPSTTGTVTWNQAMTLDSNGNLLVGTTNNQGTGRISLYPTSGGTTCINTQSTASTYYVGIWYTSTSTLAGYINVSGNLTTYASVSDERVKKNIQPAGSAIQSILSVPIDQFDWKSDNTHQDFGGIAQKLLPIIPEIVSAPEDSEQMMGVDWSKAVPRLLKAFQELSAKVTALEAKLGV
jgi:hypothetical protein